jgi:hypothetical protein
MVDTIMNILFISDPLYVESEIYNWEAYANLPMLKAMPCELQVATTAKQVQEMIPRADVVLLEGLRAVAFRDQLGFINTHKVFVGAFYCDVWRGPFWYQSPIRIDVNISVYREVALRAHPTWNDNNFLWLPPRVDAIPYKADREIDIVTWGASGREYPFRNFCYQSLMNALVGGASRKAAPILVAPSLKSNQVTIGGKQYTWYSVAGKRLQGPFYGPKLMKILSQCRVCPTGPVVQMKVASVVARYFENAAAGVVSLTDAMEDAQALGFVHGETIWQSNSEHFLPDLKMLIEDTELWLDISRKASELIKTRHSIKVRAMQLYEYLTSRGIK